MDINGYLLYDDDNRTVFPNCSPVADFEKNSVIPTLFNI